MNGITSSTNRSYGDIKTRLERQKNVLEKQHKYFNARPAQSSRNNYKDAVQYQIVDIEKRLASQNSPDNQIEQKQIDTSMSARRNQRHSKPEYGLRLDIYI